MTFTGGEVDRIVDDLQRMVDTEDGGLAGFAGEACSSGFSFADVFDTDEVEEHLPAVIAIEVAWFASEIASIAGEAARIARDVASILSLPKEERSLFPRRQKAKLEPKEIDGGQTGRPTDES